MINVLVAYNKTVTIDNLETHLSNYCPEVNILGKAENCASLVTMIEEIHPELLFIDEDFCRQKEFQRVQNLSISDGSFETIFYSTSGRFSEEAFHCHGLYYIVNPTNRNELINIVQFAQKRIEEKRIFDRNKEIIQKHLSSGVPFDKIGIPTIDGIEYLDTSDIIRCEGLQKCTRIITRERSDIISAYNIGEFRKLLHPFGFFAPHKSHLINLRYVYKYHKEGTIIMKDKSYVPVARRRKAEFLGLIKLL